MKTDKLNTLANFMDDLPRKSCHMPTWAADDATEFSCGSSGCACGWAATIFRKEGWSFDISCPMGAVPTFGVSSGAAAFARFFEIPLDSAWSITMPSTSVHHPSYYDQFKVITFESVTPQMVATRIRDIIRHNGGEVVEDYPITSHKELQTK